MQKLVNKYPNGYADFEDKSVLEHGLAGLDIERLKRENKESHDLNSQAGLKLSGNDPLGPVQQRQEIPARNLQEV